MDLDRFAPLVIFLIIFASILRKKLARKKGVPKAPAASEKKPAAGPWLGKLVDALNQVKKEIEAANQRAAAQKGKGKVPPRPKATDRPGVVWDKNAPDVGTPPSLDVKMAPPPGPEAAEAESPLEPAPALKASNRRPARKIPLQQAVVWSEILGPPVSLRDDV